MVPEDPHTRCDPWASPRASLALCGSPLDRNPDPISNGRMFCSPPPMPLNLLGMMKSLLWSPEANSDRWCLALPSAPSVGCCPTALIVPGNSRTTLPSLPSHVAVEGPMQISVLDVQAETTYKRQVILVHLIPGIVYRPVTADAVIIDTDDFVELVVEVFEKLAIDFPAYVGRSLSDLRGILEGFLPALRIL